MVLEFLTRSANLATIAVSVELPSENFVLHLQPDDGSSLFAQDATFCPRTGNSGSGTSYQSVNFPTKFVRAFQGNIEYEPQPRGSCFVVSLALAAEHVPEVMETS